MTLYETLAILISAFGVLVAVVTLVVACLSMKKSKETERKVNTYIDNKDNMTNSTQNHRGSGDNVGRDKNGR